MDGSEASFVVLDRDGVINENRPDSVCSPDEFALLPGAAEAIATMNRKGYQVLVATNQACVGRGKLMVSGLAVIHDKMHDMIGRAGGTIAAVYVCPHTDADRCECRKPRPGLLNQARRDFGFNPSVTWMVGDSVRDVEAAAAAGCRQAFVCSGVGEASAVDSDVPIFDDLMHFVRELADLKETR